MAFSFTNFNELSLWENEEITNTIEPKLYMNGHWMVPYKAGIFT